MQHQNAEGIVESIIEKKTTELMGTSFPCVCGRTHEIPMKYLSIKTGAVDEVASKMKELGISGRGALVYDKKIEDTVIREIMNKISIQGVIFTPFPAGDGKEKIPPEIERAEGVARRVKGNADYLISIGSGVVSDLTKLSAHILDLPYVLVATAPSMNGYTSSMAALTEKGMKKTLPVNPSTAIFADTSILERSPLLMIRAGLGDIVSKSVCSADWKLSQIMRKTYFCPVPFRITNKSEPFYLDAAEEIGRRTEYGITVLTDGIMRSGLSMTVIGTSTPSSGAEHLLAHYWDLIALIEGREKLFHGAQVGVATLIILRLYDYIRNLRIRDKINIKRLENSYGSRREASLYIEKKFGKFAEGVREEYFAKWVDWNGKKKDIELIIENWDAMWNELGPYLRPIQPVENALRKSGSASHYTHLGKTKEDVVDALINAQYMRGRYTILDLAGDLNLVEEAVENIL